MKYLLLSLLLPFVLLSCQDDDDVPARPAAETDLTLDFRAEFNDRLLAIQSEAYTYPTGAELKVLLFQYYISDLELLPTDGSTPVRLADIDLLRWMSATDPATESRTYRVPTGDYSGLSFGLGVKPELNAMDPSSFAADYVLNESEFWNPNARYVFAKIEANADLENDGTYDTGLTYHMGNDALYTTLRFDQAFTVGGGSTEEQLTIVADVLAALSSNGQTFDIADSTKQAVHGGNQAVAQDIWARLAEQFTFEVRQ